MTQTPTTQTPTTQTPTAEPDTSPAPPASTLDWRAEYAYTAGVQAFIYGFPYIYNAKLRHDWVTSTQDPAVHPAAAVNEFWHAGRILDATYRAGGCPSTDSLYSLAWLDLGDGPFILSHPDMGERYFTFQLASFTSDNFGYVGQRTTGPGAGNFAVVGPGWDGDLPAGVQRVRTSPTPWALVLGRTAVNGVGDLPNARALQGRYRLIPLAAWNAPGAVVPARREVYAPVPVSEDPLGPWKTLNAMLAENPPSSRHALVLEQFSGLGVGAGLDVEAQPDAVRQGLARAAVAGMALLRDQFASGDWATIVNGWRYPPPEEGRFGNDFLRRAADQSLAGIAANDPAESVYLMNFQDEDGARLDPGHRYTLRFPPGGLPPVDAFWSLTAYTAADLNLIANPIDRYSVGDHASGLRMDDDGGLTLYLQPDPPAAGREPNWLPTSPESPWFVLLRMYRPGPAALDGSWRCPGMARND
ncbi:DUF1254 domain-containing protein [Arthrobacter sp. L77]|uniref:DUF1254 domain-containing protein n=1 Tax=Arthrobacter sp. L77 TaxID=1496689 RepID=UPI000690C19B|nr:DUF1254 domain-containing protein [Arthrobacter sp. L77]